MGLIVAVTFALSLLLVLWAIGVNTLAALMLIIPIILAAAAGRMVSQYAPGSAGTDS